MLSKIEFTKTDAKRFLAGKTTKKSHLLDRKGQEFKAELIMEEIPDKWDELIIRDYYALRMTDKQIGKRLNFSQSTVWKRRSNVIEQLKKEYI